MFNDQLIVLEVYYGGLVGDMVYLEGSCCSEKGGFYFGLRWWYLFLVGKKKQNFVDVN